MNFNSCLLFKVCLVALFTSFYAANIAYCQQKQPKLRTANVSEVQQQTESQNKGNEIDQKIREIEKSNLSPEEKEKIINQVLKENGRASKAETTAFNFNFKPLYIPTAMLSKWLDLNSNTKDYSNNIVVLNDAISLDFNSNISQENQNALLEITTAYKMEEKLFFSYIMPSLNNPNTNNENKGVMMHQLKLYFASQPELYAFVPEG